MSIILEPSVVAVSVGRNIVVRRAEPQAFDRETALLECRNFERIAKIHLKRCNCPDTAKEIVTILGNLVQGFTQKM